MDVADSQTSRRAYFLVYVVAFALTFLEWWVFCFSRAQCLCASFCRTTHDLSTTSSSKTWTTIKQGELIWWTRPGKFHEQAPTLKSLARAKTVYTQDEPGTCLKTCEWLHLLQEMGHKGHKLRRLRKICRCCSFIPLTCTSSSSTKPAPLNMNKVSSSLLNFGRKLIAPAISVSSSTVTPINTEIHSSSSSSSSSSPPSAPPVLPHPLAEPSAAPAAPLTQSHAQSQHYRLLKSESMPAHLSKGEQPSTHRSRLVPAKIHVCCCYGGCR